jgi:hypothetical protein
MHRRARNLVWLTLPIALVLALELRARDYGFVWTDRAEYEGGSVLRPPGEVARAFAEPLHRLRDLRSQPFAQPYYRPLQVVASSWIANSGEREARRFRALSLALACATSALFAALAAQLLRSRPLGALAGSLVAAHPGALEIYVWVGGQSAALANFFIVAATGCGMLALGAASTRRRALACGGSLASLALGLASKESAAVTPALLAAYAASALAPGNAREPILRRLAPLLAAELALVAAYLFWLRPLVLGGSLTGAAPIGGRAATQLATSLATWPSALAWMFAPLSSSTSDAVRVVSALDDPLALAGLALALGSAAAWIALLARGHAVAAFGLAWLWIAFLPTSGLTPLLHLRSERNLFLSLYGAALLAACGIGALRRRGVHALACAALAVLCVLGLAQRTWQRTPDWRSTRALFSRDVAADPYHREGRLNLALESLADGNAAEALPQIDALLALRSERERNASFLRDEALFELACLVYRELGRDADALALADRELADPAAIYSNPGFFECLAPILERNAHFERALRAHSALFAISQGDPRFALGAARSALRAGRPEAARAWLARIPAEAQASPAAARQIEAIRAELEAGALRVTP